MISDLLATQKPKIGSWTLSLQHGIQGWLGGPFISRSLVSKIDFVHRDDVACEYFFVFPFAGIQPATQCQKVQLEMEQKFIKFWLTVAARKLTNYLLWYSWKILFCSWSKLKFCPKIFSITFETHRGIPKGLKNAETQKFHNSNFYRFKNRH